MWWTKNFNTIGEAVQFLNQNKIEKMQIIYDANVKGHNTLRYTVVYYTESK